jgi:hypothetical protein
MYAAKVGTASHRKKARKNVLRSKPSLVAKLRDPYELLVLYGEHFDAGTRVAAYPLAVCLRVLLHQTSQSASLLTQLGLQSSLRFLDTSVHVDPRNLIPSHTGLCILQMSMGVGSSWVPLHSCHAEHVNPALRFDRWWNDAVIRDWTRETWSRAKIVLDLANKEGGGHVDPNQPLDLKALEEDNSMGWTHSDPIVGKEQPVLNGPLLPSVRQVAHEMQSTLEAQCGAFLR